jgi:MYXO-CTERM domain-containing protein
VEVSADEWSDRQQLSAPARVRLQLLVEDQPRVLTSQLWLVEAAEDSDPGGTGGDNRGGEGPKDGGCGCGAASLPGPGQPGLVGLLGLLGILARRRR